MSGIEWIAAALGFANVALLVRRSIWNYPFGLAMVALYAVIFWQSRLYGEAGLQLFFFLAQLWGWWLWLEVGQSDSAVPVRWLEPNARLVWLTAIIAGGLSLGWAMHRYTNAAAPFVDGPITAASIAAQILLALRRVENWVLWVLIDLASIGLYYWRGLFPTAVLYTAFLTLSVLGLRQWYKAARV